MHRIFHWIEVNTGLSAEFQQDLLLSIVLIVGFWLLSRLVLRLLFKRQHDLRKQYRWRKTTNYITTGLILFLLIDIWFNGFKSVATFLGLLSAGLVVALKEPVLNMAGWLFLLWKRPFRIGDRIEIGDRKGDVIDIRLFEFAINEIQEWVHADQASGRVVNIPNGLLFSKPLSNYTYGFPYIWHEIPVRLTFGSNWEKAKEILKQVGEQHAEQLTDATKQLVKRKSQRHLIFYNDFDPQVYTRVRKYGIELTLRYVVGLNRRRLSEHQIWEDLLRQFLSSPDIRFAYPTTRFYQSPPPGEAGPLRP
ncbi:mechanosensitive ion channel family protein [Pontibacter chitinilyticus]|uniref:mechanosensitive ion channel family protein n=1 Tax=Pontibacter chitinilyticus TaxID=2674989 RepID=UPI00321BDE46